MFKKLIIILLGVMCVSMVKPVKKASASSSKFITIETSQGKVVIETLPKIAPNHVKRIKQSSSSFLTELQSRFNHAKIVGA